MIYKNRFFGFIICLFMGITAISLGLGAAFPTINQIAKPLVCSEGTMEMHSKVYRPYPGKTVSSQTWYCIDQKGTETKISTLPIVLIAGSFYGFLLYALPFFFRQIRREK